MAVDTHIHIYIYPPTRLHISIIWKSEWETDLQFHLNFREGREQERVHFPYNETRTTRVWQLSIYTRNINNYNNDNTAFATACTAIDIIAKKFDELETATCPVDLFLYRLVYLRLSLSHIQLCTIITSKKSYLLFGTISNWKKGNKPPSPRYGCLIVINSKTLSLYNTLYCVWQSIGNFFFFFSPLFKSIFRISFTKISRR